ncbi:MAG: DUF1080 domain-containing protein [Bacteroidales bacterium]
MKMLQVLIVMFLFSGTGYGQETRALFDGVSLDGWEIIDFGGQGNISVREDAIVIEAGEPLSGIRWTKDFPKINYEVSLQVKRVRGSDFFCGMTFPVKDSFLTLVLGGWQGYVNGLSSIDGYDAANNETYDSYGFNAGQWYRIRLRVTDKKIEAWADDSRIVDFTIGNHDLSLRFEMEPTVPFGISTYYTTGAVRLIKVTMISDQ